MKQHMKAKRQRITNKVSELVNIETITASIELRRKTRAEWWREVVLPVAQQFHASGTPWETAVKYGEAQARISQAMNVMKSIESATI
jgi:hypothetical protein